MRLKKNDWSLDYVLFRLNDPDVFKVIEQPAKGVGDWIRYQRLIADLIATQCKGSFRLSTSFNLFGEKLVDDAYEIDYFPGGDLNYFIQAEYGVVRIAGRRKLAEGFSARKSQSSGKMITTPVHEDEVPSEYIFGVEDLDFIYALFYAILSKQDLHQFAYNGYELEWHYPRLG